jgi:hypothetical protein
MKCVVRMMHLFCLYLRITSQVNLLENGSYGRKKKQRRKIIETQYKAIKTVGYIQIVQQDTYHATCGLVKQDGFAFKKRKGKK